MENTFYNIHLKKKKKKVQTQGTLTCFVLFYHENKHGIEECHALKK